VLKGITRVVKYTSRVVEPGQTFYIYSDNQAGLYQLKPLSDNPGQACQIRTSQAAKVASRKAAAISINWVLDYTDVFRNKLADSLAKAATKLILTTDKTSFPVLGCRVKKVTSKE
jgi:hypothetical protein